MSLRMLPLTLIVAALGVLPGCGSDEVVTVTPASSETSTTFASTSTVASPSTTSTSTTTESSTTSTTVSSPTEPLQAGSTGEAVQTLQEQLSELGYWPGVIDAEFGPDTHHAVVALQKVAGIAADGIVEDTTASALASGVRPTARSSTGRAVEIDLAVQVLLITTDGEVDYILNTSTGSVAGTTPTGEWVVEREIDGLRRSRLGLLYRPKYFYGGVAMHGYTSVPSYPASHGCVRLTYSAMDLVWAETLAPIGTPVLVY